MGDSGEREIGIDRRPGTFRAFPPSLIFSKPCRRRRLDTVQTVGVLGGSITFGRGLRPSEDPTVGPWPDLLRHALRKHFPAAKIDLINGAVP